MRDSLLYSLFSQWNITLNGVTITHAADLYYYRAYLETLLTYVAMQSLHISQTRSGITIMAICAPATLQRMPRALQTRASSRDGAK